LSEPRHPDTGRDPLLDEPCSLQVVVADDHALMRAGILHALGQADDIRVIAEASDGMGALAAIERQRPDVCLLDLHMPRMDGLSCLEQIRERWSGLPVLILTVEDDPAVAREALERGAAGYVSKAVRPEDLASVVRTAARGHVLLATPRAARDHPPSGVAPAAHQAPLVHLSAREREILSLVCRGMSNKQIASSLFVATKTVKYHLTNIFAKLGASNRTEACAIGLKHGL
jgi:DNA-binding NarL/FixJ family response regulator